MFGRITKYSMWALLALGILALVSACGIAEAQIHTTYAFYSPMTLPKDRHTIPDDPSFVYRTGEQIGLTWTPQPNGETQNDQPQQVTIEAGLVGPFASVADLKSAESFDGNTISGRVAIFTPPIKTNNWANKSQGLSLALPNALAPGYYMLVQRIRVGDQGPKQPIPTGSIINIMK
ncbi:hypothetical protein EPA93_27525 [Ktedonosporobacter rubrisoli]|uniref:Uncharacterized protein n=1 Tax=Ktedonosporobacter rubrisoli TaxID=2509675 RepID=A0A4P6JV40_KTERU|nr:hypothetical protein [Ktedonosporobacter rubrisoli]QBD79528.1 hypothetical protein EPA93_27525 [Ktedonosporobacter rubrisoli]